MTSINEKIETLDYAYTNGLIRKKVVKALVKQSGQKRVLKDGSVIPSHNAETAQFILNNPQADIIEDIVQSVALAIYAGDISIEVKKVIKQETDIDNETPIEVETDIKYIAFCTEDDMKAFYKTIYNTLSLYKTMQSLDYIKGQKPDDSNTGHTINANDYMWTSIVNECENTKKDMLELSDFNTFFAYIRTTSIREKTIANMEAIVKDMIEGLRYDDIAKKHEWTLSKVKALVSDMRTMYKQYRAENPHKSIISYSTMYGTKNYINRDCHNKHKFILPMVKNDINRDSNAYYDMYCRLQNNFINNHKQ